MNPLWEACKKALENLNNKHALQKYMRIDLRVLLLAILVLVIYFFGFRLRPDWVALDDSVKLFFSLMIAYLISTTNLFVKFYGHIRKIIH